MVISRRWKPWNGNLAATLGLCMPPPNADLSTLCICLLEGSDSVRLRGIFTVTHHFTSQLKPDTSRWQDHLLRNPEQKSTPSPTIMNGHRYTSQLRTGMLRWQGYL